MRLELKIYGAIRIRSFDFWCLVFWLNLVLRNIYIYCIYMYVWMLSGQKEARVGRGFPPTAPAAKTPTWDTRELAGLDLFLNLLSSRSWSWRIIKNSEKNVFFWVSRGRYPESLGLEFPSDQTLILWITIPERPQSMFKISGAVSEYQELSFGKIW